jgi:hypothetical protein
MHGRSHVFVQTSDKDKHKQLCWSVMPSRMIENDITFSWCKILVRTSENERFRLNLEVYNLDGPKHYF